MNLDDIKPGIILWGIIPQSTEQFRGKQVHIYPLASKEKKGILFPNDDVIFLGRRYNAYVNSIEKDPGIIRIFSETYHIEREFEQGEELAIKISQLTKYGQGCFRIKGEKAYHLGFVFNHQAKIGDKLLVRIDQVKPGRGNEKNLEVDVVSVL
jgi:predicted RNA-binding protein with TRAM domain